MKIAFLVHNIFNDGGVQRVVTTLSNLLSKECKVDIICTNIKIKEDRDKYGLYESNIKVIYEPIEKDNIAKKFIFKVLRGINKHLGIFNNKYCRLILTQIYYPNKQRQKIIHIINKNKYDVVIGCEGYYGVLLGVIKDKINAKTVAWQHNVYDAYFKTKNKYYWNRDILFNTYLKKVDKNIVLTKYDKEMYSKYFKVNSKVMYNPVSFTSIDKSHLNNKIIVAAGRFVEQKGFDNLIKAFSQAIKNTGNDWKLWLIGNGEEENQLKKLSFELGLEGKVIFKCFTNNIQSYFKEASIYAMSSRWEGFGLVVTEALEMGLPVVAFDVSGPREILRNYDCGIIVRANDIKAYSSALLELMSSYDMRKEYSINGQKRVRDFYQEKILENWSELLKEL